MTEPYERKCENWLSTFSKWTIPVCESPYSFIAWTGLFVISSVLRRKVCIPKSVLGRWSADPNLYIFFVGQAGKVRKTTTMGPAQELFDHIGDLTENPEIITKEDLLRKMAKESPDGSMYIFSPEFSEFISKSGPSMYSFLTNMYDGKKKLMSSTVGRPADYVEKPCLNMLAATTPEWISQNMGGDVIGGGFASRVIFVYEDDIEDSRRRLSYRKILEQIGPQLVEYKQALVADLQHINTLEGEFTFTEEAEQFIEEWYLKNIKTGRDKPKLSGYYERRPAHVLKVSMLVHVAYSDELVINKTDLEVAISIVTGIEKNLPRVFASVGKNPYAADADTILEYIVEKGRVTRAEIRQTFRSNASPTMLEELVDGLLAAEFIILQQIDEVVDGKKQKVFYLIPNFKLLGVDPSTVPEPTQV